MAEDREERGNKERLASTPMALREIEPPELATAP
jgi:hypothetical protein